MNQRCIVLWCLLFFAANAKSQFYFRGEVKDTKEFVLAHVRIHVHSTNSFYYSGASGNFGIPSARLTDTVSFLLNGYEEKILVLNSKEFNHIILRASSGGSMQKKKLLSFTKDKQIDRNQWRGISGETYSEQTENVFNHTQQYPTTGFAMNVDKASYSNIRRFINMNSAVPPYAVRIEEMLNYFPQQYKEPPPGKTFHVQSQLTDCPWSTANKLLFLQLHARKINYDHLPPSNFVFLVDVSGSMDLPNRLPLLKTAFRMMVQNMRTIDTISMVVYGGTVAVVLQPTSGNDKEKIMGVIDSLAAGGDTPGESAIRQAYNLAQSQFIKGGNNRIILATDGDFNVGEVSEDALMLLVTQKQQTGIYLTCLGVGMGNFKDSKLATLAKKGNGNYAYLDDIHEAEKVLVKELTQTFYAVADDVFMNLKFNAALVKEYRLIGFDNRRDAVADSSIDLEGGEIGSGNNVLAIFEIVPASDKLFNPEILPKDIIANIEMRYSLCDDTTHLMLKKACLANYTEFKNMDKDLQFATAVAMFGLKIKQSKYIKQADWKDIKQIATESNNPESYLQTEFLQLIDKAEAIYNIKKRKKNKKD